MPSRREFLIMVGGVGMLVAVCAPALGQTPAGSAKAATAITQVFGDGVKLIAVAVEYDVAIKGADLSSASFRVEGRIITGVFASTSADPANRADAGRFVIVTLSVEDAGAALAERLSPQGQGAGPGAAPETPATFRPMTRSIARPRRS